MSLHLMIIVTWITHLGVHDPNSDRYYTDGDGNIKNGQQPSMQAEQNQENFLDK